MGAKNRVVSRLLIRKGTYRDSITLLRISKGVEKVSGVTAAAVVMGTPLNKRVLSDMGFGGREVQYSSTDDLVIAIAARDSDSLDSALKEADGLLNSQEPSASAGKLPSSLDEALAISPNANLVMISVPGAFAKRESAEALEAGLNVFCFSSNVSREDELVLKELADSKGLLMMGPDCGTAILNGIVLGFGNAVRRGSIGIVSASGTGLQEVSTLVHKAGLGISQAVGTGGGDLSDAVGGIMTSRGIELLNEDPGTKVIVVISKPPGAKTAAKVLAALNKIKKPVVINFLGAKRPKETRRGQVFAHTLEEAAALAIDLAGGEPRSRTSLDDRKVAYAEASKLAASQRFVRGLYSGGTLCYEAEVVMSPMLGSVYSNVPLDKRFGIRGTDKSRQDTCIDMGADEFVIGRAHPMIDFTLRKMRILEEARDPKTAVILLDLELGLGSNPDPGGELVPAIAEAKAIAGREGRYISVVASILGTEGDFQDLAKQEKLLKKAGVVLVSSNAGAARLAALIATRGKVVGNRGS